MNAQVFLEVKHTLEQSATTFYFTDPNLVQSLSLLIPYFILKVVIRFSYRFKHLISVEQIFASALDVFMKKTVKVLFL